MSSEIPHGLEENEPLPKDLMERRLSFEINDPQVLTLVNRIANVIEEDFGTALGQCISVAMLIEVEEEKPTDAQ